MKKKKALKKALKKAPKKTMKKRGRPKGSKNKVQPEVKKKIWKKKFVKKEQDLSRVKFSKFLGYCPCGAIVALSNKICPRIYVCSTCGKRKSTSKLRTDSKNKREEVKNKREYMLSSINTNFADMPLLRTKTLTEKE